MHSFFPGRGRQECESILKYLKTVIEDMRRISRDLCPSVLEDLGLTRALQWMAGNFEKNYDIRLTLDLTDIDRLFSKNDQTSIYRILQEALTNIVKHSGAGNASVSVWQEEGMVSFVIEDDGKGFDVTRSAGRDAAERGLGLASMRERISILGGSLTLSSGQGKGTHIAFSIPGKEKQDSNELLSHLL